MPEVQLMQHTLLIAVISPPAKEQGCQSSCWCQEMSVGVQPVDAGLCMALSLYLSNLWFSLY